MRLEGSLDAFSLPDIFQLLSFTKKTGALHLRRAEVHGVVYFAAGSVTGAVSDDAHQALGRRLIGSGRVEGAAVSAAVDRVVNGGGGLGLVRALSEAGSVEENVLREVLAEQIVDSVFDLLRWPDGDFAFAVDDANPDDIGLALPVDELVAEARRRIDYWAQISQVVPSRDAVLALAPAPANDPAVSRDEWRLLGLVDGRRSVNDLVAVTGKGEYALVAALAALVERGLLVLASASDGDAAGRLMRHLALLAPLETGSGPQAAPPMPPPAPIRSVPAPAEQRVESARQLADAASRSFVPQATAPMQRTAESAVASAPSVASIPPDERNVTPSRADTVVPRRRPDFPEEGMSAQGSTSGVGSVMGSAATAPATAPVTSIERDPSVNKSLLLRLIAGVRGL
ncbi:MAG: hypothetical protein JWM93_1919 [Frankiales bacterium]|nr:hypothetical protein [Frankiales bacterium]